MGEGQGASSRPVEASARRALSLSLSGLSGPVVSLRACLDGGERRDKCSGLGTVPGLARWAGRAVGPQCGW